MGKHSVTLQSPMETRQMNPDRETARLGGEDPERVPHRLRTYVGDPGSHHLIVQAGDLRVVLVPVAAQLEPQGPVRNHHGPTNQLENRQKILVRKKENLA